MALSQTRLVCRLLAGTALIAPLIAPALADTHDMTAKAPMSATPSAVLQLDSATGIPQLLIDDTLHHRVLAATLGIRTTDADFGQGLRLLGSERRAIVERYRMTTGKRLDRAARMTETRYRLEDAAHQPLTIAVRVAPDGVAYRYEFPRQPHAVVTGEASSFTLPDDAAAWLLPYNPWYEKLRIETSARAAAAGDFGYPSLFRSNGTYVLLTEANVDGNYAGSFLQHDADALTYRVHLADPEVQTDGVTPWRTVIMGNLATVTESTLVDNLATPARFTDTSWIRPGKVAWSWLSDRDSPGNIEKQKQFVDFASRHRWPYVLVDEGWKASWLPELAAYAKQRHVDVLLWFKWQDLDTDAKRKVALDQIQSWGVKGIKVDFMNSDSQARYRWYDAILADTAQRHLMIDLHGSTIPHGLARTWPHIMSMEAVRGTENDAPPLANTIQTYTRNVVGSMDFTPVAIEDGPKLASVAHEVALSVAYETGWLSLADSPQAYERHPQALAFIDQVPTTWDDTRLLAGSPGQDAVIARRHGDRWFIGAISAGNARALDAPLTRLGQGPWLVDIVHDAPGTGRADLIHETTRKNGSEAIHVEVPANGGFAAIVCPARPGRTSCYDAAH